MNAKFTLLSLLFGTIYSVQNAEAARILGLFAFNGRSHFVMFQEVMKALADAGHQVDVVSHFPQKKPYPNYTDIIDLRKTLPVVLNNITYELLQSFTGVRSNKVVELAGTQVCDLLRLSKLQKLIRSPPTDPPYDLVVAEFFLASCFFAFGRHLNVPVVALSSGLIVSHANDALGNPHNAAIVSEISDRPVSSMNYWQRLKNMMYIVFMNLEVRYYMREQNAIVKQHFGLGMPDIEQLERELSLLLVNSHYIFHGIRPLTPAIVEVAGLHVHDDDTPLSLELQEWLDGSRNGFIYFSFGSMVKIESFPKETLTEIYTAFAKVAPIRILMKVASPNELPPGLPDNVLTLNWVPQVQVLKHENILGFLTHGGLMGLQEAVTFAVPLIGIPLFADQMGNIDMCVHRGVAVALDHQNLKAAEIVTAIRAVSNDPKYKNNMNAMSKQFLDRPKNARDTAVFWIEYILKYGGDALRSPAVKLTWWQLALIDVYGTVLATILLVLYVIKLLFTAILHRVFYTSGALPLSKKRD